MSLRVTPILVITALATLQLHCSSHAQALFASASGENLRGGDFAGTSIDPSATTAIPLPATSPAQVLAGYTPASPARYLSRKGSTYVPVDSWIYPALMRLYSKGFVDSAFLGMRPWTRLAVAHMLDRCADQIADSNDDDAKGDLAALQNELTGDVDAIADAPHGMAALESVYTRPLGIAGTPLRDSFHVGQTIINDYGRPYQAGFHNITGFSARAQAGRFSGFVRGEYQHAPSAAGYSLAVAQTLSALDTVPFGLNQATIPQGPIGAANPFRLVEADLSYHLLDHEFSFGKTDAWLGPGRGGAFAWSNNAENIYSFRIDRVEPLRIPGFARLFGPIRYEFFVGSLKGHTAPNDPWVHVEKISLKPTPNFELGFERTVIWGGKGHVPITVHSFLRSFFNVQTTTLAEKFSRDDPGARFGAFDFSYRLPYLRNWLTLYSDSEAHDDVNPISAPRRAAIRPGLYLSHFPGAAKLDFRVEAAYTDPNQRRSQFGNFMYWETVQQQGYTNKGNIMGDWIGREAKGGQAWLTYHLSSNEWIEMNYRRAKAAKDFVPGAPGIGASFIEGGTTQDVYGVDVTKRLGAELEVNGWLQVEHWKVPLLASGGQTDTAAAVLFTWHPHKVEKRF